MSSPLLFSLSPYVSFFLSSLDQNLFGSCLIPERYLLLVATCLGVCALSLMTKCMQSGGVALTTAVCSFASSPPLSCAVFTLPKGLQDSSERHTFHLPYASLHPDTLAVSHVKSGSGEQGQTGSSMTSIHFQDLALTLSVSLVDTFQQSATGECYMERTAACNEEASPTVVESWEWQGKY